MEKIKVMVSSKVFGLEEERKAVQDILGNYPIFELVGASPYVGNAAISSPAIKTASMAKECDLYILILGNEFGFELPDGRSATEIEFDAAVKQDPTKVLVFIKKDTCVEEKQKKFIEKVSDYFKGYWREEFDSTDTLCRLIEQSIISWLKEKASFGNQLSYCDHFIWYAQKLKPNSETIVYYKVDSTDVEIEYKVFDKSNTFIIKREQIYKDFWGSVYELQKTIEGWM